jgi:hypothetical protein
MSNKNQNAVKLSKPMALALASIVFIPAENLRDKDLAVGYPHVPAIAASIEEMGQETPIMVEKQADGYHILRGFSRYLAVKSLADKKAINPKTGKVFDSIDAVVVAEPLDDEARITVMLDEGGRRNLTAAELMNAIERGLNSGMSERKLAILLRGGFEYINPPKRPIIDPSVDGGKDLGNYVRGVMQPYRRAIYSPAELKQAWYLRLQGKQKWPTGDELKELKQLFDEEQKADTTCTITLANPGPKWKARWEQIKTDHLNAIASGETRGKSGAMFSRAQISASAGSATSRLIMITQKVNLRELPAEIMPEVDAAGAKLEKGELSPEDFNKVLNSILEKAASKPAPTVAPEPVEA